MTFGLSHSEGETDEDEEEEIYLFILLISKCSEEFNPPFPVINPLIVIICTNFHQNQGERERVGLGMTFGLSHSELEEKMRTRKEGE